jgi:hypothetical protein
LRSAHTAEALLFTEFTTLHVPRRQCGALAERRAHPLSRGLSPTCSEAHVGSETPTSPCQRAATRHAAAPPLHESVSASLDCDSCPPAPSVPASSRCSHTPPVASYGSHTVLSVSRTIRPMQAHLQAADDMRQSAGGSERHARKTCSSYADGGICLWGEEKRRKPRNDLGTSEETREPHGLQEGGTATARHVGACFVDTHRVALVTPKNLTFDRPSLVLDSAHAYTRILSTMLSKPSEKQTRAATSKLQLLHTGCALRTRHGNQGQACPERIQA